jgi:hypothetical protein
MSEEKTTEPTEALEKDALLDFLETLVPPENINFENVFGDKFKYPSMVSARKQIKILRIFDSLQEVDLDGLVFTDVQSVVDSIVKVATNETVLKGINDCFVIAYPKAIDRSIVKAKKNKYDYEEEFAAADLFSIEELASAIIPLFLRLVKKSGKVLTAITA